MKKQIWKYPLNMGTTSLEIPKNAEVLTVQLQKETLCIWMFVNPNEDKSLRTFEVYATGQDIFIKMGEQRKYINTFQVHGGTLVFHVFELTI